jgi:hypothetical protein
MTLSSWTFVMMRAMDAVHPAVAAFFVAMIIFGAYFVVSWGGRVVAWSWVSPSGDRLHIQNLSRKVWTRET